MDTTDDEEDDVTKYPIGTAKPLSSAEAPIGTDKPLPITAVAVVATRALV